jgi:hypothetical protein
MDEIKRINPTPGRLSMVGWPPPVRDLYGVVVSQEADWGILVCSKHVNRGREDIGGEEADRIG